MVFWCLRWCLMAFLGETTGFWVSESGSFWKDRGVCGFGVGWFYP